PGYAPYCNPCKDQCQACLTYNECLEGLTTCKRGEHCAPFDGGASCQPGCAVDPECGFQPDNFCCHNRCVTVVSDPMNCGYCDQVCPPTDAGAGRCVNGHCQ